jgi:replicative DNA helicase
MAANDEKQVQLPHSVDAEMTVLGACIGNEYESDTAVAALTAEDFYIAKHKLVFQAIAKLRAAGKVPDLTTLADMLERAKALGRIGGSAYLVEMMNNYVSSALLDQNIEIIKTKARLRMIAKRCKALAELALAGDEKAIEEVQGLGYDLSVQTTKAQPTDYATVMEEVWDLIEERYRAKKAVSGVPTGFQELDLMTSGMQPGDYIILAARPSMGKTALALNIAENAARLGFPGLIISLEMSRLALGQRSLSGASLVNMQKIRTGRCFEGDFVTISHALGKLSGLPLWIDDSSRRVAEMRAVARRLIAQHGIKFVAIDYLQLIEDMLPGRTREQEVSLISRQIKGMARELNIPVMALSQLSRATAQRTGHRPSLADLRDSGSLEQDADLVMFIHRDDYYDPYSERKEVADLIVAKQRNGPVGEIELMWDAATTTFRTTERRAG